MFCYNVGIDAWKFDCYLVCNIIVIIAVMLLSVD